MASRCGHELDCRNLVVSHNLNGGQISQLNCHGIASLPSSGSGGSSSTLAGSRWIRTSGSSLVIGDSCCSSSSMAAALDDYPYPTLYPYMACSVSRYVNNVRHCTSTVYDHRPRTNRIIAITIKNFCDVNKNKTMQQCIVGGAGNGA